MLVQPLLVCETGHESDNLRTGTVTGKAEITYICKCMLEKRTWFCI